MIYIQKLQFLLLSNFLLGQSTVFQTGAVTESIHNCYAASVIYKAERIHLYE